MSPKDPRLAAIVSAFATAVTVVSFVLSNVGSSYLAVVILIGIITLGAEVWAFRNVIFRSTDIYSFKDESDIALGVFFEKWYSKPGAHHVVCNDLLWLEGDNMACARRALKALGGNLHLYLADRSGGMVSMLSDAHLHELPSKMSDRAPRLSLIESLRPSIAIRFKSDSSKITFQVRREDDHLVKLARAFVAVQSAAGDEDKGAASVAQ